ncbi:MAG: hypothetical protein CM1200mP34_0930 [Verrucomicrobiales bacterium]|nr:MAG: hypothetical protein CM1200mP34_0930 [Verrucomicrobiales bacterium]
MTLVPTKGGAPYYRDGKGNYWRGMCSSSG